MSHGCHNVRKAYGVMQGNTAVAKDRRKAEVVPLFLRLCSWFLLPQDTHSHTHIRTLTHTQAEAPFVAVTNR